jgi:purine-binding chemotaxis protein CheW
MADYMKPVIFKLNEEMFGVDINKVQGIEKQINIVPVPNSTSYIDGIINLRGEVVPVYDLKKKFGMKSGSISENFIIVRFNGVALALGVDAVLEIDDLPADKVVSMPSMVKTSATAYLDRVANLKEGLVILLDIDKLLTDEETNNVKKLADDMAQN